MAKQRILACPLCGETQYEQSVCKQCGGALDPDGLLLAEASFGPWYVRDEENPFAPGMTYDLLIQRIRDEKVHHYSLVRGPTTRQLWIVAKRVPGIAHILGRCHQCDGHVDSTSRACPFCEVAFGGYRDRDSLGLETKETLAVEPEGVSSFLGDTVIFDTCSDPLTVPTRKQESSTHPANNEHDTAPGTPAFQALQRRVAGLQRSKRTLVVILAVVSVVLLLTLINIVA